MHILVPVTVLDLKAYDATTGTPRMKWHELSQIKTNMAGASTNKTLLLDVYCSKTISDIEFILLYVNSCSNLQLPYWKYDGFSLEDMNDEECNAEFRFLRDKHIT